MNKNIEEKAVKSGERLSEVPTDAKQGMESMNNYLIDSTLCITTFNA